MSSLSRIHQFSETTINLPTLLATAISVGLHGLIWVVEPTLSSSKSSSSEQRTVGVVQLTPSEMSRLPEYSLARSYLPNVSVPPPTNILPPLPSLSTYPPGLPLIPPNPNDVPVKQSPSANGVRGRAQVTVPGTPELSSQDRPKPSADSSRNRSTTDDSGKPLQSESSLSPKAQLGSDGLKESIERYLAEQDSRNPKTNTSTGNEDGKKPLQTNNEQPDNIAPASLTEDGKKPTRTNNQRSPVNQNGEKPTRSSDRPSSGRLPLGVTEGMLPETASVSGSTRTESMTTETGNNTLSPENLQAHLPHFYPKPSASGSTPENTTSSGSRSLTENQKNALAFGTLSTWLEDRRKQFSRELMPTPMPDRVFVKSPLKVKLPDVTVASVIILVNPEGKKIGDAELIRSTGDSRLDRTAIDNIQKRSSLPPTGKYEAYLYQIEIDQDGLPAATTRSPKR
ncbi:MAG TPA: energy transducer TonB [Leptolyngbyaceae cyanobacterium]